MLYNMEFHHKKLRRKSINKKRQIFSFVCVILAAVLAILVHALPGSDAGAVEEAFDSGAVQLAGFPVVASAYFVILYLQILLVIQHYRKTSPLSKKQTGLRFGAAFGLIYLIGMQEVMLSASPYQTYGIDFIVYEIFMGLGDAIPAFALCFTISTMYVGGLHRDTPLANRENDLTIRDAKRKIFIVMLVAAGFFLQRMTGYMIGYIESDIQSCPLPILIWTLLFGLTFGIAYIMLEPIYSVYDERKREIHILILSLGINWIWFNLFIGLIYKGMWVKMLLRGVSDVFAIYIFYRIAVWLQRKW